MTFLEETKNKCARKDETTGEIVSHNHCRFYHLSSWLILISLSSCHINGLHFGNMRKWHLQEKHPSPFTDILVRAEVEMAVDKIGVNVYSVKFAHILLLLISSRTFFMRRENSYGMILTYSKVLGTKSLPSAGNLLFQPSLRNIFIQTESYKKDFQIQSYNMDNTISVSTFKLKLIRKWLSCSDHIANGQQT